MIIACDVDGVVAALHQEVLNRYNFDYRDSLIVEDIHSWDMALYVKPECGTKIYQYFSEGDLYKFDYIRAIENAAWGVDQLENAGHRVVYVTTPAPGTNGAKAEWLRQRSFLRDDKDYVECRDKSLIRADVLIDDGAHNLREFIGKRILFHQPWNANEYVDGAYRVNGWIEIPNVIKTIKDEWNRFDMGSGGTP